MITLLNYGNSEMNIHKHVWTEEPHFEGATVSKGQE